MASDSSRLKSPINKNLSQIWLYLTRLFLPHQKNIDQLVKMSDELQTAATWFSLNWLQQIFLQFGLDLYTVLVPRMVYPPWLIKVYHLCFCFYQITRT